MGELLAAAAGEDGMGALVQRLFDARDDGLPYLTHQRETVTRGELRERVAKQAAVFAGYDIGPGSTVGLRTPPSFTQVEVLLALWRLGDAVWVFVPGEHYQTLQTALRARFARRPILVVTLTGGWLPGYVPTAAAYGKGIYQESIGVLTPSCLEILTERVSSEVQALLDGTLNGRQSRRSC